jgi:uncharacterized Fe-S center protein
MKNQQLFSIVTAALLSVFLLAVMVSFTGDISPAGLMAVYNALGQTPTGRVAVKITAGESPNSNHLKPALLQDLVRSVNGTLVESNTAYGGRRASTATHSYRRTL